MKKLLRRHHGHLSKLSPSEKAELSHVRQLLSQWRSLSPEQRSFPPVGSVPALPPASQNVNMGAESAAIGKIRSAFSKAEITISPITKTPLMLKKIKHTATSPQSAIESFLVAYPAWGRLAKDGLRDCKHIQVKNQYYEGVVVNCHKQVDTLPVEDEWIRFFLKKETAQAYHVTKVVAYWHRSHTNNQAAQFKHQEETLWALLQNKQQDLEKKNSVLKKALRFNTTRQRYEPIWTGLAAAKDSVRKWHVLVDDTTDHAELQIAGQESSNYQGRISAHVVTPTSTRFSNAQGQFGFQSQVCRLGGIHVEEAYTGCYCGETFLHFMEYTSNEENATHGWLNLPLNSACQANCSSGFFLKVKGNSNQITDGKEYLEHVANPPPQGNIIVGFPTTSSCGLDPSNLSARCNSDCGCMCYQIDSGIGCHLDPLMFHTYYHLNYFLRTLNANGPFSLGNDERITFNLHRPPLHFPPHHLAGTIHLGTLDLVNLGAGAGKMYQLIYHEAAHAYSHYTGTLGGGASAGPPNSLERIAYNEGLANYIASSLSDFTSGYAPTFPTMVQPPGLPEAVIAPINEYRFYPDHLNTTEQCPRNGPCGVHHSGIIWENAYIELEKRVGKATALQLVLHHGLHANVGVNLFNSSFVRKSDLYNNECLVWPFILGDASASYNNGDSIWDSFYAAMQESNALLFSGKYTLEIWDAFDRLLGRQRECLRQPDDFSNYKEAATFIHPPHSVVVDRSPHFREGQFAVPAAINYEGDQDWFYFYAAQEKDFFFQIDPRTLGLKIEVSVHRADGSPVLIGPIGQTPTYYSMSGIGLTAQIRTLEKGYYYLRLRAHSSSETKTGPYSFALSPNALPDADAESNQRDESATVLSLQGAASRVEGNIHHPSNEDYYRFLTTGQQQSYKIHLQALQQQSLKVVVYVNDHPLFEAFTDQHGAVHLQPSFGQGQWVFVKVSSGSNFGIGRYQLSVEGTLNSPELGAFSQTFEDPATHQTVTENADARSITTPIVLAMDTLHHRLVNTIVDDLPRYYRFWAEREEHIIIETFGLKQTASTRLFLYEQINQFPPLNISQTDASRLTSQGLPALRQRRIRDPVNNLMALPPRPPGPLTSGYAELRTGNGSIARSFGDSLEIGAGRIHFNAPHSGWYVVGVQPETVGDRGDYAIQVVRHSWLHSSSLPFYDKHQCVPPTL